MALTSTLTAPGNLQQNSHGFRDGIRTRLAAWRLYRQTRDELAMLSDRELSDLGLHRSGITAAAREAAWGN